MESDGLKVVLQFSSDDLSRDYSNESSASLKMRRPSNTSPAWTVVPKVARQQRTIFFDLDNTLYPKSLGIHTQMAERIRLFMQEVLNLPEDESRRLGAKYYLDYGLAIRGIVNDFNIDTDHYDRFVDGGLELEHLLKPCPILHSWLESIQGRRWIFTNAGIHHAERVLGLLGIRHLFEGVIHCDYGEAQFPAKPERLAFERAMKWAGVCVPELCYFIDDSSNNIRVAHELGWKAAYLNEEDSLDALMGPTKAPPDFPNISTLMDFTTVFPELLEPAEEVCLECRQSIWSSSTSAIPNERETTL